MTIVAKCSNYMKKPPTKILNRSYRHPNQLYIIQNHRSLMNNIYMISQLCLVVLNLHQNPHSVYLCFCFRRSSSLSWHQKLAGKLGEKIFRPMREHPYLIEYTVLPSSFCFCLFFLPFKCSWILLLAGISGGQGGTLYRNLGRGVG